MRNKILFSLLAGVMALTWNPIESSGGTGGMKETVCILNGQTKCRKPGDGCSELIRCPGLDKWVTTVGGTITAVGGTIGIAIAISKL